MTLYAQHSSPIGTLLLLSDGEALTGLTVERPAPAGARLDPAQTVLAAAAEQLCAYFGRELRSFQLPLNPTGTPFQLSVWALLQGVPYGATTTYGRLASELGNPGASRAVGLANGRNPISIVIPCHRVVGAGGGLTGYAWGAHRKRFLLELEGGTSGSLFDGASG